MNGRLTETVRYQHPVADPPHTPPHTALLSSERQVTHTEAPRGVLGASGGPGKIGRAAQSVSSASTRSISRRRATSVRLVVSSSSKFRMLFVISVMMS